MRTVDTGAPPATSEPVRPAEPPTAHASTGSRPADPPLGVRLTEILQTVLTGLTLAFIFRAFLVEPFIIPTGSMANTLLGAHATQVCPACGWEFDFAPLRTRTPTGVGFVCPPETVCPNCQLRIAVRPEETIPKAGDRVVVHKWPYALGPLFGPRRWDVVVFRDPGDPLQHYIKRSVGLPGETIEIIDGDVFIDGRIARKPEYVQEQMWFIVFDQAHLPTREAPSGRNSRWVTRDPPPAQFAGWTGMDTRVIRYDGLDSTPRRLTFNVDAGPEYLLDLYAYNRHSSGAFVRDVRVRASLVIRAGDGECRWTLDRPPHRYSAVLRADGDVRLELEESDPTAVDRTLLPRKLAPLPRDYPVPIEFAHVDGRTYLRVNGRELLASDQEPEPARLRKNPPERPVTIEVAAHGLQLELHGLRIDRDVHYTSTPPHAKRAFPGHPFRLGPDEYFMLGDNSPDSHDSREWSECGPHLAPNYRIGTVPASQIVGQAAFVYLPGLLPVDHVGRWYIPDVGRMRFVR